MSAFHSGNSLIPSQAVHDAHFAEVRREGVLSLGRLSVCYTYCPDEDDYVVDDVRLAPATRAADLWRNGDAGARLIDAIKEVLAAQQMSFSQFIAEQEGEVVAVG